MYRFLAPFGSAESTRTDNIRRQPVMSHPQNLSFTSFGQPLTQIIHHPTQYTPSFQGLPFPYPCPPHYSPQPFYFWPNHHGPHPVLFESPLSQPTAFDLAGHEQKVLNARATKAARNKRKMARQRSLDLHRRGSSASSTTNASPSSNGVSKHPVEDQTLKNEGREELHTLLKPDGKQLRMILKKKLKNSDVGYLGRIVLPKREAEENLPVISDREGIQLVIRDVHSQHEWILRYRYWSNNNSRMYLFENAGELVRQNGLDIGDSITFYEDECKKIYFSFEKVARPEANPRNKPSQAVGDLDLNTSSAPYANEPRAVEGEEEEATLALLMGQFRHSEGDAEALAANFSADSSVSYRDYLNVASEATSRQPDASAGDDQQIDFDGYYRGLETLTNMDPHTYSLLDQCWIGNSGAAWK